MWCLLATSLLGEFHPSGGRISFCCQQVRPMDILGLLSARLPGIPRRSVHVDSISCHLVRLLQALLPSLAGSSWFFNEGKAQCRLLNSHALQSISHLQFPRKGPQLTLRREGEMRDIPRLFLSFTLECLQHKIRLCLWDYFSILHIWDTVLCLAY